MTSPRNPIIAPLDVPDLDAARARLERLDEAVERFKIGKQLFTAAGPDAVALARSYGKRVFLDLKYHDIPNTVGEAVRSAASIGAWMVNIHVGGGRAMLEAAAKAVEEFGDDRPLLIGVTVLTSLDDPLWREVYGDGALPVREQVLRMATLAQECGLDGVVASPQEVRPIRERCGPDFLLVTPGVRPGWAASDDQKRTMTPGDAIRAGADYLVIGRPIARASDPLDAARRVLAEIDAARAEREPA